ncbi:MAG TPA: hypothetical protein VJ673_06335 [Aromatoleum sp.]|uniref:hypothetical protein n=1 Tax=Aromatoleum sp. TaxID=2307007 RepID=UPI002B46AB35|nr:hypothetical protein [Aromatoleum sp.]HJV25283.1 hypothetical protein [Aromatoleum sp.]
MTIVVREARFGQVADLGSERWIMMSFAHKHHDIALIRAEAGARQGGLGLQHYGLEIEGRSSARSVAVAR